MFNRFLGTAKPVQPKEDKPVDMTRLNEQMSRLDQREERLDNKLQDVERQMAEWVNWSTVIGRVKQEMIARGGQNNPILRNKFANVLVLFVCDG